MKKILLIFFLFTSQFSFSKSHPIPEYMMGISFSPEYNYRFLKASDSYSWVVDARDKMEVPKFGYTLGFIYSILLQNKLYFETGALYSNKGYSTKKLDLIYDTPEPNAPVSLSKRYTLNFLEIPLHLNYQVFDSCGFFISLGIAIDLQTSGRVKTFYQYADGSESDKSTFTSSFASSAFVSATGGIGYFIKLGKRFFLKTEPFFKCNITPYEGNYVQEFFYSYGLDVGLYFSY